MKKCILFACIFFFGVAHAAKVPDLSENDARRLLEQGGANNPNILAVIYNSNAPRLNLDSGNEIVTVIYTQYNEEAGTSTASSSTMVYSHYDKQWIILIPTNDNSGYFRVTEDGAEVVQSTGN